MRHSTLVILALLIGTLPACGRGSFRVVHSGGYSFDKTGEKRSQDESGVIEGALEVIEIDHEFGEVKVYGTDGPAEYSWSLSCWGRTLADAERFLGEIQLVRETSGGTHRFHLEIPKKPGKSLRGVESMLTVRVPAGTAVRVKNSFGDAEVSGISGAVTGNCTHCSTELTDLSGSVDWETSFDDLRAERIAGGTLKNSHGELRVDGVLGDLIANTSFDDAHIRNVRGRVTVRNEHGELTVSNVGGALTASTSFAALVVENLAGDVVLRNSHGAIRGRGIDGEVDAATSFDEIDFSIASERVKIQNSHGDVVLALNGERVREVEIETSFADLDLTVPAGMNPTLFVDQKHGDLKSPLPVMLAGARESTPAGAGTLRLKVRHGDIEIDESNAAERLEAKKPIGG